jgi:hypothetical protein
MKKKKREQIYIYIDWLIVMMIWIIDGKIIKDDIMINDVIDVVIE